MPTIKAQAIPETYFVLTEIVLILVAGTILYNTVASAEAQTQFTNKFLAREFALILDTLPLLNGNAQLVYDNERLKSSTFTFENGNVRAGNLHYPYALPHTQQLHLSFQNPSRLFFFSESGRISITDKPVAMNTFALSCPPLKQHFTHIILDPAYGNAPADQLYQGSKGQLGKLGQESELTRQVAARLAGQLRLQQKTVDSTRSLTQETAVPLENRKRLIQTLPDALIIGFTTGKDEPEQNDLKIHINAASPVYDDSYALACNILNTLTKEQYVTGASIIPYHPQQLTPDDARHTLLTTHTGVYLELGNIDNPNNKLLSTITADLLATTPP